MIPRTILLKVVFADVVFVYLIFILGGTYIAVDEKKETKFCH